MSGRKSRVNFKADMLLINPYTVYCWNDPLLGKADLDA